MACQHICVRLYHAHTNVPCSRVLLCIPLGVFWGYNTATTRHALRHCPYLGHHHRLFVLKVGFVLRAKSTVCLLDSFHFILLNRSMQCFVQRLKFLQYMCTPGVSDTTVHVSPCNAHTMQKACALTSCAAVRPSLSATPSNFSFNTAKNPLATPSIPSSILA